MCFEVDVNWDLTFFSFFFRVVTDFLLLLLPTPLAAASSFWPRQANAKSGKIPLTDDQGATFSLNLNEVVGSRGRMSNYGSMVAAVTKADVVLFCVPMDAELNWKANGIDRITNMMQTAQNYKCVVVVVGTFADQKHASFDIAEQATLSKLPFIATSTYSKEGLAELPNFILNQFRTGAPAFQLSPNYKKLQAEKEAAKEARVKAKEEGKATILGAAAAAGADEDGLPVAKKFKADKEVVEVAPVA